MRLAVTQKGLFEQVVDQALAEWLDSKSDKEVTARLDALDPAEAAAVVDVARRLAGPTRRECGALRTVPSSQWRGPRTKTSPSAVSPSTKVVASGPKATKRPLSEIDASQLAWSPSVPLERTLTRFVLGVTP